MWKSWKTSLIGLGIGAGNLFLNGAKWQQILLSLGFAALGLVAKDNTVTGVGATARTLGEK